MFSLGNVDLIIVMSNHFSDSENFETFCVTRLDKMLEDVKDLEADLRQQKEGLREKLLDLSRTLQLD